MTDHPMKLRRAVNVKDFNRREELLGRLWLLRDRVKRDMARIAKWNAANPDAPISDAFEKAMLDYIGQLRTAAIRIGAVERVAELDYLDGKGPMPAVPDMTTPTSDDATTGGGEVDRG